MCLFSLPLYSQRFLVWGAALAVTFFPVASQLSAQIFRRERAVEHPTSYRTIQIDGLSIFYREAGPKDAPTLLLLHGFPSSSRMFEPLIARLSNRYHLSRPIIQGSVTAIGPTRSGSNTHSTTSLP